MSKTFRTEAGTEVIIKSSTNDLQAQVSITVSDRCAQNLLAFPEFLDVFKVLIEGEKKHKPLGWLEPDGAKTSRLDQFASLNRHCAKYFIGEELDESGLPHELHIACRALMSYTRKKRGIVHPDDPIIPLKHIRPAPAHIGENCVTMEESVAKLKTAKWCKQGDE
jgi:hypothetical protein